LVFAAARAFSEMALKPEPGGSMNPFCEQLTVTSTSTRRAGNRPSPARRMVSTSSNAGWPTLSVAARISPIRLVTPVEVSLCTTMTALMAWVESCASLASIAAGSAPWRQSPGMKFDIDAPARRHLPPPAWRNGRSRTNQDLVARRQRIDDRRLQGRRYRRGKKFE